MTHNAVGVVTHSKRMDRGFELADTVEAKVVSLDPGRLGAGVNHLKCWRELYDTYPTSKWLIVLEDDAQPIPDFRRQLRLVLDVAPRPIVSLYLGRTRPGWWQPSIAQTFGKIEYRDDLDEPNFLVGPGVLHCVALAVRTSLVPLMYDSVKMSGNAPIDEAISIWSERHNHWVAYTQPSLVDHDYTAETLIPEHISVLYGVDSGTRNEDEPPRRAWKVGGRPSWNKTTWRIPTPMIGPHRLHTS